VSSDSRGGATARDTRPTLRYLHPHGHGDGRGCRCRLVGYHF
jgi:hypothetical protein